MCKFRDQKSMAILGLLVLLLAGLPSLYGSSHFLHLKSAYDSSNLTGKQINITDPENNTNIHFTNEQGIIELEKPTGIEQDFAQTATVLSNYPNPFSRETTFRIRPETETFRVYNIRGQLIADFSDEVKKGVGSSELKNISSGVYFAKVGSVDNRIECPGKCLKKLIITLIHLKTGYLYYPVSNVSVV